DQSWRIAPSGGAEAEQSATALAMVMGGSRCHRYSIGRRPIEILPRVQNSRHSTGDLLEPRYPLGRPVRPAIVLTDEGRLGLTAPQRRGGVRQQLTPGLDGHGGEPLRQHARIGFEINQVGEA